MDKSALRQAILALLEAELALQTAAANASRSEATDADSRAEGKYDMRAQSAAYLAAGQARFATEISEAIAAYHSLKLPEIGAGGAIVIGAVVGLQAGRGERSMFFLGPARGGLDVECDGTAVTVITAASPIGRQLIGKKLGDTVDIPGREGPVSHTIAVVA
jgi:transcription elongation GreA/GreB family factor